MGVELDITASLSASLDGVAEAQRNQNQLLKRIQEALTHTPIDVPIAKSGVIAAGSPLIFSCGHPSRGRLWEVRRLTVGGTNKAGKAYFYVTSVTPATTFTKTAITAVHLVDLSSTWPNKAFYGTRQLVVKPEEHLWCVVTTGTTAKTVSVGGMALDYEFAAYRNDVEL